MVMVSSAVLGAAAGTGLALLLAVTIVMYRYYLLRRRGKEWEELDRWEATRIMRKLQLKKANEQWSVKSSVKTKSLQRTDVVTTWTLKWLFPETITKALTISRFRSSSGARDRRNAYKRNVVQKSKVAAAAATKLHSALPHVFCMISGAE
ncbi:hypothetical protein ACLKA6_011235 [Drosophila palustris]